MSLTTGNQLKAARALAGINQTELSERAGVNVNTIRNMEGRGAETLVSGLDTVRKVQSALEAAGVIFLDDGDATAGGPGVRLGRSDRGARG
ncbi:helix-turn-helix transcriptional regulator [Jiella sonneratiae]|uniref:Helix-turn-helix transcriptional regulator n=1 Tax=Jiella sonneratiae TaxID=2816856 RepID=A0ABS3J412_9HYPH|nr:helix-turn-helix transcriptional regulator [Jiella sonneratiae]MBO0903817.1 helix-turn-helix transcriptional regulator [Jiella sonneratiae]